MSSGSGKENFTPRGERNPYAQTNYPAPPSPSPHRVIADQYTSAEHVTPSARKTPIRRPLSTRSSNVSVQIDGVTDNYKLETVFNGYNTKHISYKLNPEN